MDLCEESWSQEMATPANNIVKSSKSISDILPVVDISDSSTDVSPIGPEEKEEAPCLKAPIKPKTISNRMEVIPINIC